MRLQDLGQRLTAGLAEWTKPTLLLTGDGDKYIKVVAHSVCHCQSAAHHFIYHFFQRLLTPCLAAPQPAEAQAVAESNPGNISAKVIEAAGHQPQVQTVEFECRFLLYCKCHTAGSVHSRTLLLTTKANRLPLPHHKAALCTAGGLPTASGKTTGQLPQMTKKSFEPALTRAHSVPRRWPSDGIAIFYTNRGLASHM